MQSYTAGFYRRVDRCPGFSQPGIDVTIACVYLESTDWTVGCSYF